jgi:3-oxoacyl-[acyl-carrier-protein] synthase III
LRISSIAVRYPSLKVTNADILSWVAEHNPGVSPARLHRYQRQLERVLRRSGSQTRYFRDRSKGETALSLLLEALKVALARARIAPADVDLLIYCGVGRGFLEPAMAYFISNAAGLRCECFDVLDACLSWVRSLYLAHSLFRTGSYSRIVVVNGEFNIFEAGFPQLFHVDGRNKWRYTFPAFTIGEAATATVLARSDAGWNFHFRSDPSLVELCTLPLPSYGEFSQAGDQVALNGPHSFMSFGMELSRAAVDAMVAFVRATYPDLTPFDLWFPHAASLEACRISAERLGLGEKLYSDLYARYGNLVSASIPAAMCMAEEEHRLARGSRVVLCPASAGMALALVDLVY